MEVGCRVECGGVHICVGTLEWSSVVSDVIHGIDGSSYSALISNRHPYVSVSVNFFVNDLRLQGRETESNVYHCILPPQLPRCYSRSPCASNTTDDQVYPRTFEACSAAGGVRISWVDMFGLMLHAVNCGRATS
jgi:hypothetical protein